MQGLVVCPEPLAAKAGSDALTRGGTAVEAAIACAFAQGVVNPLLCGIGGTALLLHYDAGTRLPAVVNGEVAIGSMIPGEWPALTLGRTETVGRYAIRGDRNQMGYNAVMVPGFVAACWEAWNSGPRNLPWSALLAPAEKLAGDGFAIDPYIARYWDEGVGSDAAPTGDGYPDLKTKLSTSADARDIYLNNGARYRTGDFLRQTEYARSLARLGSAGGADFYLGEVSKLISQDMEDNGGALTAQDLATYRALPQDPFHFRHGRYELIVPPAPSMGPQLAAMLNTLLELGFERENPDDPFVIDALARIMRSVLAGTRYMKATPIESSAEATQAAANPAWARELAERIAGGDRMSTESNGFQSGTTHVTVVDATGNIASMTHSIGSVGGAGLATPQLGFLYNNFLGHFNPVPGHRDSILPGRRLGSGCPLIVLEDGIPVLAAGAPGGSRIVTSLFQVLALVLLWKLPLEQALAKPRFHSEERQMVLVERALSSAAVGALERLGNEVRVSDYTARVQAIDLRGGRATPGADPRGGSSSRG